LRGGWPQLTGARAGLARHSIQTGRFMELGIYTFGVTGPDPATGETISVEQRFANLIEEIELADQVRCAPSA
jgi:hypothetical protein